MHPHLFSHRHQHSENYGIADESTWKRAFWSPGHVARKYHISSTNIFCQDAFFESCGQFIGKLDPLHCCLSSMPVFSRGDESAFSQLCETCVFWLLICMFVSINLVTDCKCSKTWPWHLICYLYEIVERDSGHSEWFHCAVIHFLPTVSQYKAMWLLT